MNSVALLTEELGKRYRIGLREEISSSLAGTLSGWVTSPLNNFKKLRRLTKFSDSEDSSDVIWALRDISFEIPTGQVVGIIGSNGAGKTTLLKILARITHPSSGRAEIHGRVSSLLEVGTGFHPDLTGRENVFLNGAILGMSKKEIESKFDEIVAFSGVEKFIETPVKRYSSGMRLRLAFSVAAHLEPEILLIDEVLAVGDAAFQRKCLGKMEDVAQVGRTVLFVSHHMGIMQTLCERGIYLREGQVSFDGTIEEAVRTYLAYLESESGEPFRQNKHRAGNGKVILSGASLLDDNGCQTETVIGGRPSSFSFEYENRSNESQVRLLVTIFNPLGISVTKLDFPISAFSVRDLGKKGKLLCTVPQLNLPVGRYRVAVEVRVHGQISDQIANALYFNVEGSALFPGGRIPHAKSCSVLLDHSWHHEGD